MTTSRQALSSSLDPPPEAEARQGPGSLRSPGRSATSSRSRGARLATKASMAIRPRPRPARRARRTRRTRLCRRRPRDRPYGGRGPGDGGAVSRRRRAGSFFEPASDVGRRAQPRLERGQSASMPSLQMRAIASAPSGRPAGQKGHGDGLAAAVRSPSSGAIGRIDSTTLRMCSSSSSPRSSAPA